MCTGRGIQGQKAPDRLDCRGRDLLRPSAISRASRRPPRPRPMAGEAVTTEQRRQQCAGRIDRRFVPPSDVAGTSATPGERVNATIRSIKAALTCGMSVGTTIMPVPGPASAPRHNSPLRKIRNHHIGQELAPAAARAMAATLASCVTTRHPRNSQESRTASSTSSNMSRARWARSTMFRNGDIRCFAHANDLTGMTAWMPLRRILHPMRQLRRRRPPSALSARNRAANVRTVSLVDVDLQVFSLG